MFPHFWPKYLILGEPVWIAQWWYWCLLKWKKFHLSFYTEKENTWLWWYFIFFNLVLTQKSVYFFPPVCWALSTRTTIFCSSMRKARTILSRTHLWQHEPPYVRDTVFMRRDMEHLSIGRDGRIWNQRKPNKLSTKDKASHLQGSRRYAWRIKSNTRNIHIYILPHADVDRTSKITDDSTWILYTLRLLIVNSSTRIQEMKAGVFQLWHLPS